MSFGAHIFKLPVPKVVVKNVLRALKSTGTAHDRNAFPHAGRTLSRCRRSGKIEVDVIGDHQVQQPIAIVIHECATGAPGFPVARSSRLFSDFGEDSILIVVEPVLSVIGDVEIVPPVVVVIANANALAPA